MIYMKLGVALEHTGEASWGIDLHEKMKGRTGGFLCWEKKREHDPSANGSHELRGHKWDMRCMWKKHMTMMSG